LPEYGSKGKEKTNKREEKEKKEKKDGQNCERPTAEQNFSRAKAFPVARLTPSTRYMESYTNVPSQLSLAIPPRVDAMSTSESWGENRHTAR